MRVALVLLAACATEPSPVAPVRDAGRDAMVVAARPEPPTFSMIADLAAFLETR